MDKKLPLGLRRILPVLILVLLLAYILWPAITTRKKSERYWNTENARKLLLRVEKGDFLYLRQYGLELFDNKTVTMYFSKIDIQKPRIMLLFDKKIDEERTLNYRALGLAGNITINVTRNDDILSKIEFHVENWSLGSLYRASEILLNRTGSVVLGVDEAYFSVYGTIVFVEIDYVYHANMLYPICNMNETIMRQLFVFDNNDNIALVASYNTTLLAK